MVTVKGTYSDKENGWVSEVLHPDGDIYLRCTLPQTGLMLIRQQTGLSDDETGYKTYRYGSRDHPMTGYRYEPMGGPKIFQSRYGTMFKVRLTYQQGTTLQIFTTDTPTKIEYANI